MLRYVIRRILMMIPVLLGISFLIFFIMSFTPGDPASSILGTSATKEQIEKLNDELGMNDPFLIRYFRYVRDAVQGDFGTSYRTQQPVVKEIADRFGTTLSIAVGAIIVGVLIGVPFGITSAVKQYSWFDITGTVVAMFFAAIPQFWLALMAMLFFSVQLGWLPSTGLTSWRGYIMPIMTLGLPSSAHLLRLTRSSMLEIIRQDYIRTARAKGAAEKTVVWTHALRNALLPIITIVGINFGNLLGGTVVIESIFGIPGVGTLTMTSIRQKDIPQTTGSVLFLALIYSVLMLLVDLLYAYVDPRIKAMYSKKKVKAHE